VLSPSSQTRKTHIQTTSQTQAGTNAQGGEGGHNVNALPLLQPLRRPHVAHRLDVDTGGLMIVAKTKPALQVSERVMCDMCS